LRFAKRPALYCTVSMISPPRFAAYPRFGEAVSVSIHQYPIRYSASLHVRAVRMLVDSRYRGEIGIWRSLSSGKNTLTGLTKIRQIP